MISYNWGSQEMVKTIKKGLDSSGFNVWLDIEQMAGSTLEASMTFWICLSVLSCFILFYPVLSCFVFGSVLFCSVQFCSVFFFFCLFVFLFFIFLLFFLFISSHTLLVANAVEQADVVLICYTKKYKESAACRTEAEYAFTLKKPIVPLKMEKDYVPDGWYVPL
jgi:TIR domain